MRRRNRMVGSMASSFRHAKRLALFSMLIGAGSHVGLSGIAAAQQSGTTPPPITLPETEVEAVPTVPTPLPTDTDSPSVPETDGIAMPQSTTDEIESQPNPFDVPSPVQTAPRTANNANRSIMGPAVASDPSFGSVPSNGYFSETSTVGSLIPLSDIELPASASVVTSDTLTDQQVLRITEALRNVPAATAVGDGLFGDRFFLRGLEVRSRDFRKNGFLDPTFTPRDFANVERLEILKGPASTLYGSSAPSGTVNVVTKKPVDASFTNYDYQFGSFGLNRHQVDMNGRLNNDGSALYRFNGAYEDSDSFRDFGQTRRYLIAPTARWFLNDDTMLTWEGEIIENNRRGDVGVAAINGNPLALPRSRYLGEPASDFLFTQDYRSSMVLDHRFDDDWALQIGASGVTYQVESAQSIPVAQVGPTQFFRLRQNYDANESAASLIANLRGRYRGVFDHQMLIGTEQAYYDSDTSIVASNLGVIDAANPTYTNPTPVGVAFAADFPVFRQARHGYYLQDYITLNQHWQVLAGVRFDDIDLTFDRNLGLGSVRSEQRFVQSTPRVGLVYQPLPDIVSTYFNYSRSFNPPGGGGFPLLGGTVRAEEGELFESGIKALLDERLTLHVAGFHVERQNVPFADFTLLGPVFTQLGLERSQGAEVELLGNVTRQWDVIANYAYVDTRLTDPANVTLFGQRARNVPLNQWSLWNRYDLVQRPRERLGLAAGVTYVGDRTANLAANVGLPSYTRWDTGLYYHKGYWDSSLYVENLFNENYATSSINEFQVLPGAPTSLRMQLGMRF